MVRTSASHEKGIGDKFKTRRYKLGTRLNFWGLMRQLNPLSPHLRPPAGSPSAAAKVRGRVHTVEQGDARRDHSD